MQIKQILQIFFQRTKLPCFEIELILAFALKTSREFVLAHPEYELTNAQVVKFKNLISKRIKGLPSAYIIGHKEFYGLDFMVNKNVLIPRPETELMVEEALKHIIHNTQHTTIIDVGTGSGCIIIALAKRMNNESGVLGMSARGGSTFGGNYEFFATDISKNALTIVRKNAKLHGVNNDIKFIQGNILEPFFKKNKFVIRNCQLIILANLPYLTSRQIKNSPTIKHEPRQALDGGVDGLKYYSQLFEQIKKLRAMSYELRDLFVLCEIDPSQTNKIKRLVKERLPKASCQIKKDLSGHNRLAIIKLTSN